MRIAVGADDRTPVTDHILDDLKRRGHQVVVVLGPAGGRDEQWPDVGRGVAQAVARGEADQGVVLCHTGTGVSIAANKVPGVRAALCTDAQQAAGARKWNDANVLALSMLLTGADQATAIMDAWFAAKVDESERSNIDKIG